MPTLPRLSSRAAVSKTDTPLRIREAAIQLFSAQGFAATSMRDLTDACGLTPGAFYNHFSSKEALLYDLIIGAHNQLESEIGRAVGSAGPDPANQLKAITRSFAMWHCDKAGLARVANNEYKELSGAMLRDVLRRRLDLRNEFNVVLREGRRAGKFEVLKRPETSDLTALSIVEMLVAIADWYRPSGPLRPAQVGDFYVDLVGRMVAADGSG